jgi:hypothetical protein
VDLTGALLGREPAPDLVAYSHTSTLGPSLLDRFKDWPLVIRRIRREDATLSWVSAREKDMVYKWVFDGREWSYEVFDLATDPVETRNLYDPDSTKQREMVGKLHAYKELLVQAYHRKAGSRSPKEIDHLRALGYLEDEENP